MKTKAVRLYGANDLRLDEFELPEITEDEILVKVISDSVCMSTYKCAILGEKHKRVHEDVARNPAIMGHEFAGVIVKVGRNHGNMFKPGMRFALQPALNYKGTMWSPGYSYAFFGGNATYCIIPGEAMEMNCLMEYRGRGFYEASLAEPMSCCIGAFHACYHTRAGSYHHEMGTKAGGRMAMLAADGPMGLGSIAYALCIENRPSLLAVTDINQERLDRAAELFCRQAAEKGVQLQLINTAGMDDPAGYLKELTGGTGYDDVFSFAPVASVVELASDIAGRDCCLNFFAGPTDTKFAGKLNYYDVHYNSTHVIGTSGGNNEDMIEALDLSAAGKLNPAVMVTHIGGLNCCAEVILNLPKIPGGKKLIYNHIEMPLTAITDFRKKAKEDPRFTGLADICEANRNLWCPEAEAYLLKNW